MSTPKPTVCTCDKPRDGGSHYYHCPLSEGSVCELCKGTGANSPNTMCPRCYGYGVLETEPDHIRDAMKMVVDKPETQPDTAIGEILDKIFTKLSVVDFDKSGKPVYEESKPFNSQLTQATSAIREMITKARKDGYEIGCQAVHESEWLADKITEARIDIATKITQGGRGGTEIFYQGIPLGRYIEQLRERNNQ